MLNSNRKEAVSDREANQIKASREGDGIQD